MSNPKELAEQFLAALAANEAARYEAVLSEDAALRLCRWDGSELYRPRRRVVPRFLDEWSAWPDPALETFTIMADGAKAAIEFRIQATENARYVEHNRSAFLTIKDDRIQVIDLYCREPIPSARRKGWTAPATMTEAELLRLFESMMNSGDRANGWRPKRASATVCAAAWVAAAWLTRAAISCNMDGEIDDVFEEQYLEEEVDHHLHTTDTMEDILEDMENNKE